MKKLISELYSEGTLNNALERLETLQYTPKSIDEVLGYTGLNRKTLERTVQKGMEEYVDGLVDLRHGVKPKMMDGSPEEKRELYGDIAATIKRMEEFSEPYVSVMRLISKAKLRELIEIAPSEIRQNVEDALNYEGARYDFDEKNIRVVPRNSQTRATIERKRPSSVGEAYSQIAAGFMDLKDLLNLMEDATTPDVYQNVGNTNEFPEARIGKCFEAAHEIDRTMRQVREGYEFLLKKGDLSKEEIRKLNETVKFLKSIDRDWITRATQWYAALQFHEKPWDRAYKGSLAAVLAGVAGAAYSFYPVLERIQATGVANTFANYTNEIGLFLASAAWTIISGLGIYAFTDAGPKTARRLRKLDEKFIRYERV